MHAKSVSCLNWSQTLRKLSYFILKVKITKPKASIHRLWISKGSFYIWSIVLLSINERIYNDVFQCKQVTSKVVR